MANQPGRQQPLGFWFPYWSSQPPQRPMLRPVRSRPPTSTPPQPPTQPQAQPERPPPSQTGDSKPQPAPQPQPPSPSPSTRGAPQTPSVSPAPSPSRRSSQAPKPSPVQSPLPSKKQSPTSAASRSSSPSEDDTKPPPARKEVAPPPSLSPPPPQSPSTTPRKAAPQTPLPSPAPSPSRRLSQAPVQSSSPSQPSLTDSKRQSPTPTASRSPSPGAAKPQQASHEVSPPPSFSPPPASQAESTQPQAQDITSEPTSQREPEDKTRSQVQLWSTLQAQEPDQSASQTSDKPSQPKQVLEVTPIPAAATQQPKSKIEPEEIKEEEPQTSIAVEELSQPSQLPQEHKPRESSEEKPKPEPEVKQAIVPTKHPELETVSEGVKNNEPKPKPETQQAAKTRLGLSGKPKERIKSPDSSPTTSDSDTSEASKETRISRPTQLVKQPGTARNGNNAQERNIAIPTAPRTTPRREEQGSSFQRELKESISKLIEKLNMGQQQPGNGNASTIITLAGANKGASMVIGYKTTDSEGDIGIRGGHKLNKEMSTNNNERQAHTDHENEPMNANINNNVQSINNSLLHESSCNERDPGVHLVLSSKPTEHVKLKEKLASEQKFKTTSTTTPAQKLTYKPNISRKYLRGLFSESSEDDQDYHRKPPHNGSQFSCDDKKKSKADNDGIYTTNSKI